MKGIEEIEEAEIAKFTPVELKEYEDSLKTYRDLKNSLDTAEEPGRVEGRLEGRLEGEKRKAIAIARNLESVGMSIADVSKATGLQEEEIKELWIYCNSLWLPREITTRVMNGTFIRDNDNIRVKGYLSDTQRFTPPPSRAS